MASDPRARVLAAPRRPTSSWRVSPALRQRIEDAGRDPAGVRIVAVTKGFPPSAVDGGASLQGSYDIGENYADEFLAKVASVARHGLSVDNGAPGAVDNSDACRGRHSARGAVDNSARARRSITARRRGGTTSVRCSVGGCAPLRRWCRAGRHSAVSWKARPSPRTRPGATVLVEVETTAAPGRNGCRARRSRLWWRRCETGASTCGVS